MTLTVGSLFSGIGGLDLGLERAGMRVVWQSEIDPYASRVLAKHWPRVPNLGDITAIDWSTVERPDVICGGYPCQPFSLAGVRRGEDDPRHLWPHFHRAIRLLRPRYALLENVPGHLSLGFDRVLGDLAEIGYDTEWCSVPAAAVGAPHLRWRLFVVAYPNEHEHQGGPPSIGRPSTALVTIGRGGRQALAGVDGEDGAVADADRGRLEVGAELDGESLPDSPDGSSRRGHADRCGDEVANADSTPGRSPGIAEPAPRDRSGGGAPQSGGCGSGPSGPDSGAWWAVEPDVGRVAHGVPSRVDRLRTLGNAVVPQVAELVGRWIMKGAA